MELSSEVWSESWTVEVVSGVLVLTVDGPL